MFLKKLSVIHFKNIAEFNTELVSDVVCITGKNGSGKTNLIDAIHYLTLCKSFLGSTDAQNIRNGESMFMIQGVFEHEDQENTVVCGLKKGQKKIIKKNQKEYDRLVEHIGQFPLVSIAPQDILLVWESGENRRKWIDGAISQFDRDYLFHLLRYNHVLKQRNAFLKNSFQSESNNEMLQVFDDQLQASCEFIFQTRKKFIEELIPMFQWNYNALSSGSEVVNLNYESQLHDESLQALLLNRRTKDWAMQHTTAGIHRDDLGFMINELSLRKMGSQGQQKTFLIALKLAQFDYISQKTGKKPFLLLDDIFEKLDEKRIEKLLNLIGEKRFGQVFITHTNSETLNQLLGDLNITFQHITLAENLVTT
jgi:DNA replication and repair protein RecF